MDCCLREPGPLLWTSVLELCFFAAVTCSTFAGVQWRNESLLFVLAVSVIWFLPRPCVLLVSRLWWKSAEAVHVLIFLCCGDKLPVWWAATCSSVPFLYLQIGTLARQTSAAAHTRLSLNHVIRCQVTFTVDIQLYLLQGETDQELVKCTATPKTTFWAHTHISFEKPISVDYFFLQFQPTIFCDVFLQESDITRY